MKSDNEIGNLFRNADVLAACGALILLVGVTSSGVIMHYYLGGSFVWQGEMQLALIIWMVFLGGRYAFVYGNHATIDVTVEISLEELQKSLNMLIAAATVTISCYVGYQGVRYIIQMARYDRMTNILKIPYSLIYASLPIGCLTMAVRVYLNTCRDLAGKGEEV